jgi:hypothetical protein
MVFFAQEVEDNGGIAVRAEVVSAQEWMGGSKQERGGGLEVKTVRRVSFRMAEGRAVP